MKISALRLFNVRCFMGRGIAIEGIGAGVNVLSEANERGKSTSFEALHALFFQPHTSTGKDVKLLRPYVGGSPLIEADINTAQGAFRITKQFFGGRSARVVEQGSGRVIALADEAEAFIARLVGGSAAGPAGLLWVRQGVTGIERRAAAEEEEERQTRHSLLESVQGEVEAITGGRRMAAIMASVAEELEALVTPGGKPKEKGRYKLAIEERDALRAEEQRLADDVRQLRTALDSRATKRRALAEIESRADQEARGARIAEAQKMLDVARGQDSAIRVAEMEVDTARERHEQAETALSTYRKTLGEAAGLEARRVALSEERSAADQRVNAAAAIIADARQHFDQAEADERDARARLDQIAAAEKALTATAGQARLEQELVEAEALRHAVEEGEAALLPLQLAPQDVENLAALDLEIAALSAAEAAERPSVTVFYDAGAPPILMDGVALAEGAPRLIDGAVGLVMPGIGRLRLHVPVAKRRDGKLKTKQDERRDLLMRLGIEDLAAARRRQAEVQARTESLLEQKGRLKQCAPDGVPVLREAVAAGRRQAQDAPTTPVADAAALRVFLESATERRKAALLTEREADQQRGAALRSWRAAETALAETLTRLEQAGHVLGPSEERSQREAGLIAALTRHAAALADAEGTLETRRASAIELASAEAALNRANSVKEAADKEARTLSEAIAELNGQIKAQTDEAVEESWRDSAERLAAAEARVVAFEKEVALLTRLRAALDAARSKARELYLQPVMRELKPLLGLLFDDVAITFDEKTLLPQRISRRGQEEDVYRLSGGMREQLSVLTRLAFARLLAHNGHPTPVILDDALVYSDDDRIEKMFTALHRQSRDQQIIVFSCRQRAFRDLGGTVLTMKDWTPA